MAALSRSIQHLSQQQGTPARCLQPGAAGSFQDTALQLYVQIVPHVSVSVLPLPVTLH